MRKTLIALAPVAAIAAAFTAVPAAANAGPETVTITVQADDLDLTTEAGQTRLQNRVDTAIDRACRSGGRDLTSRRAEAACRNSLGAAFAPEVALAINNAGGENYAALEFSLKA